MRFPKINFKKVTDVLEAVKKFSKNNAPTILVVVGLVGLTGAIVSAASATKEAEEDIREKEAELNLGHDEDDPPIELSKKEKFKLVWKHYILTSVLWVSSTTAIIFAHKMVLARLASITTVYALTKDDLIKLKDKIRKKDGESTLKDYEQSVASDKINIEPSSHIYRTGHGDTLFIDPFTGIAFYTDIWHVERAIIHLIEAIRNENYYELSDFRDDLDLPKAFGACYFAFTYGSNKDLTLDNFQSKLFNYIPLDPEHGDNRAAIEIMYRDRLDPSYEFEQEIRTRMPY